MKYIETQDKGIVCWLILFSILAIIPISDFSLWVDESMTAFMASQTSIGDLYESIIKTHLSESQMPGYLAYIWTWTKVFGISEYVLRLANTPFLILFVALVLFSPMEKKGRLLISGITCFSPVIWFYLNEARYIILLFSFSGISIISLQYYYNGNNKQKKTGIIFLTASTFLGIFFNMLYLFYLLPLLVLAVLFSIKFKTDFKTVLKDWKTSLIFLAFWCISLGIYYLWTIKKGAGGVIDLPGFENIAFTLYEFLGFSGIGPPRDMIRKNPSFGTFIPYMPQVAALSLAYISFSIFIIYSLRKKWKAILLNPYLAAFLVGFISFISIAYLFHFRFWGRHIIFLSPLLIFYAAELTITAQKHVKKHTFYKIAGIVFIILFGISNFNIRFNAKYQKENNKLAVKQAIMLANNKKDIIWITYGGFCAQYYGLSSSKSNHRIPEEWKRLSSAEIVIARNPAKVKAKLERFRNKGAIIVFFNKALNYDEDKMFRNFIANNELTLLSYDNGFRIYNWEEEI